MKIGCEIDEIFIFKKEYGRPHCAHLELAKGAMAARAAVARLTVSKHDYHFIN